MTEPDSGPQSTARGGCARGGRRRDGVRGGCCRLSMRTSDRPAVIPFVTHNKRMQYAVIKKNYPPNYSLPVSVRPICNTREDRTEKQTQPVLF